MSYFNHFPFVQDYEIQDRLYTGLNITVRTGFPEEVKQNNQYFMMYNVKNGETPEMLADRVYDDVSLYWAILMMNDIFDVDSQWPLDSLAFQNFIKRKYNNDLYETHHYESAATGNWVESDWPEYDRIPVTNYEYELRVNDDKRKVKIPVPDVVLTLKKQQKEKIRS